MPYSYPPIQQTPITPIGIPGIVMPLDIGYEYRPEVTAFIQDYYVNWFPLMARVTRTPVTTPVFEVWHKKYRPQKYAYNSALNNTDTFSAITLPAQSPQPGLETGDDSQLMAGDVLDMGNGEFVTVVATAPHEVSAQPYLPAAASAACVASGGTSFAPLAGTIVVQRGTSGTPVTTVAAPSSGSNNTMFLIGNSRNGGEIYQSGIRPRPIKAYQYVQNFDYPVQVSGSAQSTQTVVGGDLFTTNKADQLTNMARDMEATFLYGQGEVASLNNQSRQKMMGIRQQITTNKVIGPVNAGNFLPSDLRVNALQPLFNLGAPPNFMMVSPDVQGIFDDWGSHIERLDAGSNTYGVPVETYRSGIAPGVDIVININMRPGSLFVGRSELLFLRVKREEFWKDRGSRGDVYEGEWLAENAIEVRDEEKFCWVEGITKGGIPA